VDIDRRHLLMGLACGAALFDARQSDAQEAPSDPSLYIPKAHLVAERKFLHDFMLSFPFVHVVTAGPTLRITHIPSLLDRDRGQYGTILGHISAQNPQRAAFDGSHPAVVVFRGPHTYISPSWYSKMETVVPTWNFAVVHASGRPKAITEKQRAYELLSRLIATFEKSIGSSPYDFSKLPESYVSRMMEGITPFEMEIDALEGKFKLGQERAEGDRQGVLSHLKDHMYAEPSIYEVTEAFYRNPPK